MSNRSGYVAMEHNSLAGVCFNDACNLLAVQFNKKLYLNLKNEYNETTNHRNWNCSCSS